MASTPGQPSPAWNKEPHYLERSDDGQSTISLRTFESHELPPLLLPRSSTETGTQRSPSPTPEQTKPAGVQWRRLGTWTLFFVWLSVLIYAIFVLALWDVNFARSYQDSSCRPDGTFSAFSDAYYTSWSSAGFFQITMGFGELSFTQAKVVDIAWDLLVGRVGQGVIAYFSWHAFADYIATSMERLRPVTYDTFWTVFLYQEASPVGIYRLVKDASFYRVLRHKTIAVFTILSLVLIVSFPTLASAMTGYTMKTDAYVKDTPGDDGNYIRFSQFEKVAYIIHDAWRIGMTGNLLVPYSGGPPGIDDPEAGYILRANISQYVMEYGFHGLNQTASVWAEQIKLPPPVLKISVFYLPAREVGQFLVDRLAPYQDPSKTMYMLSDMNRTYDLGYVSEYGRCQSSSDVYRWGFSYIQLFIITIALLFWTLGVWLVWLKAHLNLPLAEYKDSGEVPTGWKSLLHLASAMQRDLAAADIDPTAMSDDKLRAELRRHAKGGMVCFESPTATTATKPDIPLGRFLRQKAKERKWWVVVFVVYVLATCVALSLYAIYIRPANWVILAITWLCCFGVYAFLFVGRMKWLWVYLPCSWVLMAIAWYVWCEWPFLGHYYY